MTTPKRLYHGTATTEGTTAYTVPMGVSTIVKNILITNKSTDEASVLVRVAGTEIVNNFVIVPTNTISIDLSLLAHERDTIEVSASVDNALNLYISGVEVDE